MITRADIVQGQDGGQAFGDEISALVLDLSFDR